MPRASAGSARPNDAFMTGNFHVAASLLQKVLKLDALSGSSWCWPSTYSGAFHPTAEGQAAIADAVVDKARAVLQQIHPKSRPYGRAHRGAALAGLTSQ